MPRGSSAAASFLKRIIAWSEGIFKLEVGGRAGRHITGMSGDQIVRVSTSKNSFSSPAI